MKVAQETSVMKVEGSCTLNKVASCLFSCLPIEKQYWVCFKRDIYVHCIEKCGLHRWKFVNLFAFMNENVERVITLQGKSLVYIYVIVKTNDLRYRTVQFPHDLLIHFISTYIQ